MKGRGILAIDQGTTNTKAIVVNESGEAVARASCPVSQTYPRPAWVESDPEEIYLSVGRAVRECLALAEGYEVVAVGISNQREATILWEKSTGRAIGPVVGWQCQRGALLCQEYRARRLEQTIHEKTGLTIDPMFSATKARWLLDNIPGAQERAENGELALGTMDSWLLWKLTGGEAYACDTTNASRTLLFNLKGLAWDRELLDLFGLPPQALPEVRPSSSFFGTVTDADLTIHGLPILGAIGDSHGALFGHASFGAGTIKATYGTGSSLMTTTPRVVLSNRGVSSTVAWALGCQEAPPATTYALEGNIYATGAAVRWIGGVLGRSGGNLSIDELGQSVEDSGGVYFVPAFSGLGAPHWDEKARGLFSGITLGTTAAHLARAALEAIAYQVADVYNAMSKTVMDKERGEPLGLLLADGGASANDSLMQFQADILGQPVRRSLSPELSAIGAAFLAGLGAGVWSSLEEIGNLAKKTQTFEPEMSESKREVLCNGWLDALERARL